MLTVWFLWFGGQSDVGLQVTVPSLQAMEPSPPAGWPGLASDGTAKATAAVAATANEVRLLSFILPPGSSRCHPLDSGIDAGFDRVAGLPPCGGKPAEGTRPDEPGVRFFMSAEALDDPVDA